jgi:hypothetical protein
LAVVVTLSTALFAASATNLGGQTGTGETANAFCWRGQALPACRSYWLFEFEGGLAVASTTVVHESPNLTTEYPVFTNELKWHFGVMRNLTEEWALGGTVNLGVGSSAGLRPGIGIRARRWLHPPMSVELEAGAVETGINDRFGSGFGVGPSVGARLNFGDHFSVVTRWEGAYAQAGSDRFFQREAGFHQALFVGASAGSTAAVVGTVTLGALVLWALSQIEI